jgi:phage host-nuclease inhibitor protein Gam
MSAPEIIGYEGRNLPVFDTVPLQEQGYQLPTEEAELLALGNRLLAELADVEAERAGNAAAEKLTLEEIKGRYRALEEPLARRATGICAQLEAIYLVIPHRGKAKSRKLANGTIGTRARPQRVEVTDAAVAIEAVLENAPGEEAALIVRTVMMEKLDHKALTAYVAAHGWAPLPGTEIHEAEEKFYADPLPPVAIGGAR